MKEKKYNIVLKALEDKTSFIEDMKKESGNDYIPEKVCLALNDTNLKRRVLVFSLTEEESKKLENDPRVEAIQQKIPYETRPLMLDPDRDYGEEKNLKVQAIATDAVAAIYNFPTGEDVDVVIVDGHIDPDNPEFAVKKDGSGGSRINQIDWFNVLYPYGVPDGVFPQKMPGENLTYNYLPYVNPDSDEETESNNHGAHVAGTITGNTQGWSPKANIYNISPYHGQMTYFAADPTIPPHDLYLYAIKVWHENKPINPKKGTKNPTITNHSYGTSNNTNDVRNILSVTHRGVKYNSPRNYYGATATTTVSNGRVVSGKITNQGKNYTNTPTVSFYGGGQARATAYIGNGTIYEITITDPGEGYESNVPITFSQAPAGGQTASGVANAMGWYRPNTGIYDISMTNMGNGYIIPPIITFPPPPNGGRIAKAVCKIKSGVLHRIFVNNGGTDYSEIPSVILSGGNPTTPARVEFYAWDGIGINDGDITISFNRSENSTTVYDNINGVNIPRSVIQSITYTWRSGEGYTSAPIVSFYGGNSIIDGVITGSKVEARAVIGAGVNKGKVVGVTITNQGSGYTSPPGVVFTNGGGFSEEQLNNFGLISYTLNSTLYTGRKFIDIATRDISLEADLTDLINSGIVVVAAAGNNSTKIDVPGGLDYDNKLDLIWSWDGIPLGEDPSFYKEYIINDMHYHRGSAIAGCPGVISVGSLSKSLVESKNVWSDTGPRVDVYAPGDMIASTTHTFVFGYPSTPDIRNKLTPYYVTKLSGTSMASPQVCGMITAHATTNRNINQLIATEFIGNSSRNTIVDTAGSYSDLTSLLGGANRMAYYPSISYTLYK
jgi:hypothetical protein